MPVLIGTRTWWIDQTGTSIPDGVHRIRDQGYPDPDQVASAQHLSGRRWDTDLMGRKGHRWQGTGTTGRQKRMMVLFNVGRVVLVLCSPGSSPCALGGQGSMPDKPLAPWRSRLRKSVHLGTLFPTDARRIIHAALENVVGKLGRRQARGRPVGRRAFKAPVVPRGREDRAP